MAPELKTHPDYRCNPHRRTQKQVHTQYDSLCSAKPLRFSHLSLFVSHNHCAAPCGRAALSPAGTMLSPLLTHSPVMEPHQPKASYKGYVAEAKLIATMETSEEWAKWLQLEYLFKLVIHTELLVPSSPKSDLSETPNTHPSCEKETVKDFWQFTFIRSLYFCLHLVT